MFSLVPLLSKYQRSHSEGNRVISVLIRLAVFQVLAATLVNLTVFGLFGVAKNTGLLCFHPALWSCRSV